MVEFKCIQISLFLTAVLQFTAADKQSSFTVRVGDDVTLPCENVIDSQEQCDGTTWVFTDSTNEAAVELIKLGQINEEAKSKSDRLSVTEKCSLVIKKVTVEDVGLYTCQQYNKSGGQQVAPESQVSLSVVTMTEQKDTDEVTLNCSVTTYGRCEHSVKWLFNNTEFDKNNQEVMTSQSSCSASVNLQTSHHIYTSRFNSLKCEVTDGYNEQKFLFSVRPSGDDTTTTTTTTTTTESAINDATTITTRTDDASTDDASTDDASIKLKGEAPAKTKSTPETSTKSVPETTAVNTSTKLQGWHWFIIVFVAVAALLIIVVVFIRWTRTKGEKTQTDENADPEDGVAYASISFTKKTNRRARARGKDDDEDDEAVTYSTVKASSSSAGASADPSCLYATINNPNK